MANFRPSRIIPSIAISLALLGALTGCGTDKADGGSTSPGLRLPTATVSAMSIPRVYSMPGTVISDDRIELSSRVVGFIQFLDVREGQHVFQDELLVQIDPAEINETIRQAQAAVMAAWKDLGDATRDVENYEALASSGAIATDTLRKARVRHDIAQAILSKAEAGLAGAQAQQSYAEIRSPVDGVVIIRHKQRGDMATTGSPILTIESRQVLLFRIFVPEGHVNQFSPSLNVKVTIDALPGRGIDGHVLRIIPSGDPTTRRYQVDVALPPDPDLLPGMFGRAEIILGSDQAVAVPRRALIQRGGLDGVFVIDENGAARFRWLRFGREWTDLVEITAGLSEGEKIILASDPRVKDGVRIATDGEGAK